MTGLNMSDENIDGGSDTVLFVPVTNEKSWPADVILGQKGQIMGQKGQNGQKGQKGQNH